MMNFIPICEPTDTTSTTVDPARLTRAHVVPFGVFMGFTLILLLVTAAIGWDHPAAPWWLGGLRLC